MARQQGPGQPGQGGSGGMGVAQGGSGGMGPSQGGSGGMGPSQGGSGGMGPPRRRRRSGGDWGGRPPEANAAEGDLHHGVGGPDGVGGGQAAGPGGFGDGGVDAGEQLVHRQP